MVSTSSESNSANLLARLLAPVDIASLCFFRIGFGWMMAWWAWDYLTSGRVKYLYVDPRFHFTYVPFDWVQPWPGSGMYAIFVGLLLLALGIAFGLWYRASTVLFAALFTYVFLIDKTNYQNHYYLVILLSGVLAIIPAHGIASFDAARNPAIRSKTAPAWALWLVRFHIGLPYVFGGIAKLNADWFAGEPARQMLAAQDTLPVLGPFLRYEAVVALVTWGGLLFDLFVVPLLLWKPTRGLAYALAVFFHLTNAVLFNIHIFPWFMIFATTIFFEPSWPRRALGAGELAIGPANPISWQAISWKTRLGFAILLVYCAFQGMWPLRHYFYPGDASWTEQGHFFAWRMMLRGKTAGVRYYLTDPKTGETWNINLREYLNVDQAGRFSRDPEMILQLAQFLAEEYKSGSDDKVEVRALVLTSLNGRKPQLLIDPSVDLAKEPRGFCHRRWITPLTEPLRAEPWNVPLVEWEQHVELPPLPQLGKPREPMPPPRNQSFRQAAKESD